MLDKNLLLVDIGGTNIRYAYSNIGDSDFVSENKAELDSLNDFDNLLQSEWFMPNSYKQFDIEKFLDTQCPDTPEAKQRVTEELSKFKELGHLNLLKFSQDHLENPVIL